MISLMLLAAAIQAPSPPPPTTLQRIFDARAALERLGPVYPDSVWPEFRPDTIPAIYVIPDTGRVLVGWRGPLPPGFETIPGREGVGWSPAAERGAASTGTSLAGRPTAQLVVAPAASVAELAALNAHEGFHVFAWQTRREGRRFGGTENSFLVSSYPVFDPANEAGVALEGHLLRAALAARGARRQDLVKQFIAARDARHRALENDYATFEQLGELNEGLAEYALVRTLMLLNEAEPVARSIAALDSLTLDITRSIRLRFYVTGPAQALLLDRLAGPPWKRRLRDENLTLQETLARTAGARDAENATRVRAEREFAFPRLRQESDAAVSRLRTLRRAQMDSLLAEPGTLVVIALEALPFGPGLCMMDPQNLLQADAGVLIHRRTVRFCAGAALDASFTTPVVHDGPGRMIRGVIRDSLVLTASGSAVTLIDGVSRELEQLRIQSPELTLRAARATVRRAGRTLELLPKP